MRKFFFFNKVQFVVYPVLFILTLAVLVLIDPLISLIPIPDVINEMFKGLFESKSPFTILLLVVCAPIFEELLFRGIILEGFLHKYSPRKAILWSSLLFGLIHFNPWQFIAAFAGGLLIGWLYWQTRSLFTSMFIHFVMNFSSFLISLLLAGDEKEMLVSMDAIGGIEIYLALMFVALFVLIFLLRFLKKIFSQHNKCEEFTIDIEQSAEHEIAKEKEMPGIEIEKSRQKKGCLRIFVIGLIIVFTLAIMSVVVCTIAVNKLSKDTLQDNIKKEIIDLSLQDELLNDKFIISRVWGNSYMLNVQLQFLHEPESPGKVEYWTEYVCKKCISILKSSDMNAIIVVTGIKEDFDGTKKQYGTMIYNSLSHTFHFTESNLLQD